MCQRILILPIGHSRFAIYLCVLCASVVNPPNLVAITEKNQAVPSSALRFFYFNRNGYTTALRRCVFSLSDVVKMQGFGTFVDEDG